jgi:DNA-binding MarR family transcriptional regulator
VDEHLVGTRIPDLLAARVELRAFRARIGAEQWEPLTEGEIVALANLRRDRTTSVQALAAHIGYTTDTTLRLLRRLEHLGYASESRGRGFRKIRGRYKVFSRLVAVEAKLHDWRRALVQARAHRSFAQECYVAFDPSYVDRFSIGHAYFQASGTGLLAISPTYGVKRLLRP